MGARERVKIGAALVAIILMFALHFWATAILVFVEGWHLLLGFIAGFLPIVAPAWLAYTQLADGGNPVPLILGMGSVAAGVIGWDYLRSVGGSTP